MIKIISLWRQSTVSGRLGSSMGRVLTSDQILISRRKSLLTREKMFKTNLSRPGGHAAPESPLDTLGSLQSGVQEQHSHAEWLLHYSYSVSEGKMCEDHDDNYFYRKLSCLKTTKVIVSLNLSSKFKLDLFSVCKRPLICILSYSAADVTDDLSVSI